MKTVLFLCTGNYYRSRFAELLFNHLTGDGRKGWRAISRGLDIPRDLKRPISPWATKRLRHLGIRMGTRLRAPLPLTNAVLECADRIIALKREEHLPMLRRAFPDWIARTEFWNIHDIDCMPPGIALPELERQVLTLVWDLRFGPSPQPRPFLASPF